MTMTHSIQAIVEKQVLRWSLEQQTAKTVYEKRHLPKPVITVSRQIGSGASDIARALADELQCELLGIRIMDEVARQSNIRKELLDTMDERTHSQITDWIDKMFRNRKFVDSDIYHRHLLKIINYFMEMGNVVLLGRGAGFLPRIQPRLDIRIVAPLRRRKHRIMSTQECSSDEAITIINESDDRRARFVQHVFGEDWWDARHYDLVINTENIDVAAAVTLLKLAWHDYANENLVSDTYDDARACS
jgi:cytidylate kinase